MVTTYFFILKGRCDMKKVPMTESETALPEIKRRKRKVPETTHGMANISYRSLHGLYIKECRRKQLAEETISGYNHSAISFLDFAGHDLMCEDVTQDLINEYYLYLREHHKATTVNSYVFKISPIVLYGVKMGYIKEEIGFTHCKEQREIKDIYTPEELEKLLKRPQSNDFCEFRAWTIINLFLATGIRAKELRNLKVQDVNMEQSYIILNATKNKEARILPMPTTLYNVMAEWLQIRNASREDWLFCNIYGEQIQRSVLQTLVKRYSKNRGVDRYGLHLYRHTFITLSVRKGMDSIMLKRITGHKSTKMLERYYQCNPTDLVNIVDEFNLLEDYKNKSKVYTIKTNKIASRNGFKERAYKV